MSCSLEVPCFRYFGKDLKARLIVKHGTEGNLLVRCPVRHRSGFFSKVPKARWRGGIGSVLRWNKDRSTWQPSLLEKQVTKASIRTYRSLLSRLSEKSGNQWMIRG